MVSKWIRLLGVLAVMAAISSPAFAQTGLNGKEQATANAASNNRMGPGIGIGLSVVGIGIGLGLIGHATLSGVARQPEQVGTLRGLMILLAALVEGAGIIGIVFSLAIMFLG